MNTRVAVPVYDGWLDVRFVTALLNEQVLAHGFGDALDFAFVSGNAGIMQARNQLAYEFMQSQCDRLIFLDADVTFEPGAIVKLAHRPEDVVGGAYRHKQDPETYPVGWLPDPDNTGLRLNKMGLIEVQSMPTGFLSISRACLEAFHQKWPDRKQNHMDHASFTYFQMPHHEGSTYGEDYYFCKEWRELGGKIYLDPNIKLIHWGFNPTPYEGHIGDWLKKHSDKNSALRAKMAEVNLEKLAVAGVI